MNNNKKRRSFEKRLDVQLTTMQDNVARMVEDLHRFIQQRVDVDASAYKLYDDFLYTMADQINNFNDKMNSNMLARKRNWDQNHFVSAHNEIKNYLAENLIQDALDQVCDFTKLLAYNKELINDCMPPVSLFLVGPKDLEVDFVTVCINWLQKSMQHTSDSLLASLHHCHLDNISIKDHFCLVIFESCPNPSGIGRYLIKLGLAILLANRVLLDDSKDKWKYRDENEGECFDIDEGEHLNPKDSRIKFHVQLIHEAKTKLTLRRMTSVLYPSVNMHHPNIEYILDIMMDKFNNNVGYINIIRWINDTWYGKITEELFYCENNKPELNADDFFMHIVHLITRG